MDDHVLHSPAAARNAAPILAVLQQVLPQPPTTGRILEVASGSGQHAEHFAAALPHLRWQPSDVSAAARDSVDARAAGAVLTNCEPALAFDVLDGWPAGPWDGVVAINLLHVAPWSVTEALFDGAARVLRPGAPLVIYGPFRRNGRHTSDGNRRFDAALRGEQPGWGIRDLERVQDAAAAVGLSTERVVDMPANNLTLVLRRGADVSGP